MRTLPRRAMPCCGIGLVATLGTWDKKSSDPLLRQVSISLDSLRLHESVIDEHETGYAPLPIRKDIFAVCP